MNIFSDELKKVLLAGIGAVAITAEKSKEVVDQFVTKGELTVEQGKVLNEELKRNLQEKLKVDIMSEDLTKLSKEERETLKARLEALEEND